ncbi:DUF4279 domain-containing protein [Gallaecimonas kandeliae]|uniref:DUF4279 domain-containing protein n=1 Tax=Gallaecimonas kandeliae TaxID=3029055 RepID=UPI00264A30AD|nr:DUF4279 domain-containing protein [Gallaecimonas kandeliae]WKE65378.1 DUF4279 domain-containing protein [Gallaecimonas kandeliae]
MAHLDRSVATLRIIGDDLNPDEISALLGHTASKQQTKGEVIIGKVSGVSRIAKTGMWYLEAMDATPENLDGQIAELLGKLTGNLKVWAKISSSCRIDLFCGLFMKHSNEGLSVSAESMKALGERGIELGLDLYGPDEADD